MKTPALALVAIATLALSACGGGNASQNPATPAPEGSKLGSKVHSCGAQDKVHAHELDAHAEGETEAFVPCAGKGAKDYSGVVKVESTADGIHITIDATDDDVSTGVLGSDVKNRDAVIVYPRGKGSKAVEVPLKHTEHGYHGEKTIPYDELDKLTDEGTKLDVAIFDHDSKGNEPAEEMHVQVAVSTGKSCEKAIDENPQNLDMGKKGGKADLTDAQLGAPMKTSAFFSHCGLKDNENAEICVAVKAGKALGVSVGVNPVNKRTAACIDRAARKLHFPASEKLDVVHQKF
jgi:hypothetical protein